MEENEASKPKVAYGVKLSDLTEEMVKDIFSLYSEVSGINLEEDYLEKQGIGKKYIEETLEGIYPVMLRLGSRLTKDSKIFIQNAYGYGENILKIRFSSNLSTTDTKERLLAGTKMEEDFGNKLSAYFQEKGVAIPLKR